MIGHVADKLAADRLLLPHPLRADQLSLMGQRAVIDALAVVRLRRGKMGRLKRDSTGRQVIDPDTVVIDWRR